MVSLAFKLSLPTLLFIFFFIPTIESILLSTLIHFLVFYKDFRSLLGDIIIYLLFNTNKFKKYFWLKVYNKLSSKNQSEDWTCMNYGYHDPNGLFISELSEEKYCLQLYHYIASGFFTISSYKNLNILEIGSGRGGGLAYVTRVFSPDTAIGVDYCEQQVKLCNAFHSHSKLRFVQGDAENLPIRKETVNIVINVESSHCYGVIERFFEEVYRVLASKGKFLYTDFVEIEKVKEREKMFERIGFVLVKKMDITEKVVASMDVENERKLAKISRFGKVTRMFLDQFLGMKGLGMHKAFESRSIVYLAYYLEKV